MVKKTTKTFTKEAKAIWGNQNDYSSTIYINIRTNIDIRCSKHDLLFPQDPSSHLRGNNGCPECKKELSKKARPEKRKYRVGFKQGRLEVIEELKNNNLLCKCECGRTKEITRASLSQGTESCGCVRGRWQWKGYKEISHDYFNKISKQHKRANSGKLVPFKLKIEELWDLYIAQDRKCALTGWEIFFKTRRSCIVQIDQTASLDRIDSNGIYELGNVQWVHKDIQSVKWDLSNREVIDWCRKVRNNEKSYNR